MKYYDKDIDDEIFKKYYELETLLLNNNKKLWVRPDLFRLNENPPREQK